MGLFDKLFKRKRTEKEPKQPKSYSNDIVSKAIFDINSIITRSPFLSRKEYLDILESYSELSKELKTMKESGMLSEYCDKKSINPTDVEKLLAFYVDDNWSFGNFNYFWYCGVKNCFKK